jgi:hypothetical protein
MHTLNTPGVLKMNTLLSIMASELVRKHDGIDWANALNPTEENWDAYNNAAQYIVEPESLCTEDEYQSLSDELDEYSELINSNDWVGFLKGYLTANEVPANWVKLVDVIDENGY